MNNDLEQLSEERLMELIHESSKPEIEALARIALSLKRGEHGAEMVTRRSFDKACSEARTWRERAMKAESEIASTITCYSCRKVMTRYQHAEADGFCPHCDVEIELDDDDTYTTPQPAHTEQLNSPCEKCKDSGFMDSGGTQPWGEPISVECDCTTTQSVHTEPDGWASSRTANDALVMLDRIETTDPADDDRIEGIKRIIRQLAAAPKPESD